MRCLVKRRFSLCVLGVILPLAISFAPQASAKCRDLPRASSIAASGWDAKALVQAAEMAKAANAATFMVVSGGRIITSYGDLAEPIRIASVRKSIMSALIGQAVDRGQIALTDTVGKFGVDDDPPLTADEKTATVDHLLKARSGVYLPTAAETATMKARRPARGAHKPGEFYYYNNWDFNVLGDIYERATTKSVFIAFKHDIADPICMQDFNVFDDTFYVYESGRPRFPAYHMRLSSRDLMRFGLLYLRRGEWDGRQIVPRAWVEASTKSYSNTPNKAFLTKGYGYLWWINQPASAEEAAAIPADAFTASGFGGQLMTVIPSLDTIVMIRGKTNEKGEGGVNFSTETGWQELVVATLKAKKKAASK